MYNCAMALTSKATNDHPTMSAAVCGLVRPLIFSGRWSCSENFSDAKELYIGTNVSFTSWQLWYIVLTLMWCNIQFKMSQMPWISVLFLQVQSTTTMTFTFFFSSYCFYLHPHVQYGKHGRRLQSPLQQWLKERHSQPISACSWQT